MLIAPYYIERSHRHTPCWDISTTKKEALIKAEKWAKESNCYVGVNDGSRDIALFNELGERIK